MHVSSDLLPAEVPTAATSVNSDINTSKLIPKLDEQSKFMIMGTEC